MSADSPDLNAFAAQLAALQPTAGLSRDQIMFHAGRRSAKRTTAWPLTSLALAGLALWFATRPATVVESVRLVERPVRTATYVRGEPVDSKKSYLHLRDVALQFGTDALPMPHSTEHPGTPLTPANLNSVLN